MRLGSMAVGANLYTPTLRGLRQCYARLRLRPAENAFEIKKRQVTYYILCTGRPTLQHLIVTLEVLFHGSNRSMADSKVGSHCPIQA